jgi:CRP/FNR family transcriptional regulator
MNTYPVLSGLSLERLPGNQIRNSHIARPKGSVLFAEGQKVLGVYVVWRGRVKLSMSSDNGKSLILGLVGDGTVLDLPAAILGLPHAATADVVISTQLGFISRDNLLQHLRATDTAAYAAAELVSTIYYSTLAEIKTVHLSQSADQKMACFLLGLCPTAAGCNNYASNGRTEVTLEVNQEEIGQMIGVSRETVARIISRFKKRRIITLKPPTLVILDRSALADLAGIILDREYNVAHV